ncbi:MAG: hypothetical protein K2M07_06860 [Muribaculaceae bacterium]|nr:hypothetical protein [Muribaculaceae bacterium]
MKKYATIFLLTACSLLLSGFTDTRLGIRVSQVIPDADIWDFSRGEAIDDGPIYRSYGDTLLTEYFDGNRYWYRFQSDSAFYIGEESRLIKVVPQDTILTAAFGNHSLFGNKEEHGRGTFCRHIALGTTGEYKTMPPVYGKIVLAEGDSLPAIAVQERRKYNEWIGSDSLPGLSREVIRTRWFIEGVRLPVALQITDITGDSTRIINSYTVAYTVETDDLESVIPEKLKEERALRNAAINVENGRITVQGSFPAGTGLTISIAGIMGNGLLQRQVETNDAGECTILLPSLSQGQYMLTISTRTPVSRKILFNI